MRSFHLNNQGESNIVSLIIIIAVVIVAVILFKPYIAIGAEKLVGLLQK